MILEIQYQHVFKTNEQDENDPHKLKAIVYTTERDIETSWEATNLEPDFGERRSFYVWFDKIPASAKKGLEQIEPKPDIRFTQNGVEYRNHITLKVCTDKQVPEEALLAATKNSEMLAGYYNDWQADLRKNGYSGKENTAPFPFKIYREARDIIRLAKLGATEEVRENFKLPKGEAGIKILLKILKYLRDGKSQKWIAQKIGFNHTNWQKEKGFGDVLRKLKQRANQSEENRKRLISQATEGVEDVKDDEYGYLEENQDAADFLFCSALLKELNEEKLYTKKDVDGRLKQKGRLNDLGGWDSDYQDEWD